MGTLKTHCLRGHEFTDDNTRWRHRIITKIDGTKYKDVARECRECIRIRSRRQHLKDRKGVVVELPPAVDNTAIGICPKGHVRTPENTYTSTYFFLDRYGSRKERTEYKCKVCKAEYRKKWAANGRKGLEGPKLCKNGHELNRKNTYVESAGTRTLATGQSVPKIVRRCKQCRDKRKWAKLRQQYEARAVRG
jgi:hypothetical protein